MDKMSQLEKIATACSVARDAQIPGVYLLTDEMELVDDLINSELIVSLMHNLNPGGRVQFEEIDDVYEKDRESFKSKSEISINNVRISIQLSWPVFQNEVSVQKTTSGMYVSPYEEEVELCPGPQIAVVKNYNITAKEGRSVLIKHINTYISSHPSDGIRKTLLILVAPVLDIPEGLESYVEIVRVPALEDWEIENIILSFMKEVSGEFTPHHAYLNQLIVSLKGFGKRKIQEILMKIFHQMGGIAKNTCDNQIPEKVALSIIKKEKEQMLQKSGILRNRDIGEKPIGGLDNFKNWINARKLIFDNSRTAGKEWGIDAPKGVLISGIPGTGKSLLAEEIARSLGRIPLIQLDMGLLMNRYVGQSEENMRRATELAEAMAPCVLWIDEIEKAFSSTKSSNDGDGGTLKRAFATFLTWMQDKESPCFVFATANDINSLPPELLRRGRFDQKFYTFMPTKKECMDIFRKVIECDNEKSERYQTERYFDPKITSDDFLDDVLRFCGQQEAFMTGADIAGVINDAKIKVYLKSYQAGKTGYKYDKSSFMIALKEAITESRFYGKTNLDEIAWSFIMLHKNQFSPAATDNVIDFMDFNPESNPAITVKSRIHNGYDEYLFNVLKERINLKWEEYIKKEKNETIRS